MRSAVIVAALAGLTAASPIHQQLQKKEEVVVVDVVTDVVQVWVTVTANGPAPTSTSTPAAPVVVTVVNTIDAAGNTLPTSSPTATRSRSRSKKTRSSTSTPAATTTPAVVVVTTVSPTPVPTTTTTPIAPVVQVVATKSSSAAPVAATTAAASANTAPVASKLTYQEAAVQYHNWHRANHSAPALVWEQELADYALNTAKSCVMVHDMTQGTGGYGQNLAAYGTTGDIASLNTATAVADSITNQWVNGEAANVPYGQDSPATSGVPEFLHFTQAVWVGSSSVGCATVQCGAGILPYHSLYTVCNYRSQGNVLGNFTANVLAAGNMPTLTVEVS